MGELTLFNRIPATESQIDSVVKSAKSEILSGNWNPLDLEVQLKAMEETIKRLRSDRDVKSALETEMDKYPEKSIHHGSATISRSYRRTFEYSDDEEWRRIKTEENKYAEERKIRERKLQNGFIDSGTGESVDPLIPASTLVITIKFDK